MKRSTSGKVLFDSAYDSLNVALDDGLTNVTKDSDKADKSGSVYRLNLDM